MNQPNHLRPFHTHSASHTQTHTHTLSFSLSLACARARPLSLRHSGKGQVDRQRPLLKTQATKVSLKTLPKPDGCQPGLENPASMFARDQYIDPTRSYIVDSYGVSLRFEEKSVDDESRVTRWIEPIAPGLRNDKERAAIHTRDFRTLLHKPPEQLLPTEKITYRCGVYLIELLCVCERERLREGRECGRRCGCE